MSANDMVIGIMFAKLWYSLVMLVTISIIMFTVCLVVRLHDAMKKELDESCISTSGRDCESAKGDTGSV